MSHLWESGTFQFNNAQSDSWTVRCEEGMAEHGGNEHTGRVTFQSQSF